MFRNGIFKLCDIHIYIYLSSSFTLIQAIRKTFFLTTCDNKYEVSALSQLKRGQCLTAKININTFIMLLFCK